MAVSGLVLALWLAFNVIYRLGGEGIQFSGATTSFERQFDRAMFRLTDDLALTVGSSPGDSAVVRYARGMFPFCPLCGLYEPDGSVVNLARYAKGDWIYTDHPGGPFADGIDLRTGETFDVPDAELPRERPLDWTPAALPAYAARGLTFEKDDELSAAKISARFAPLSTIHESCIVFNAAFVLIAIVLALTGGVLLLRRRGR